MNINISQSEKTKLANDYINIMLSTGFVPLISIPIRVTSTTSTEIDHKITNDMKHESIPFVIRNSITDYYVTACCLKKYQPV